MKKTLMAMALGVAAMLVVAPANAAHIYISFGAPPPLVEVEPGVQVVPSLDQEVFFSDGAYWYYADDGWYRSYDWHGDWQFVSHHHVPRYIVSMPRGHYRHWQPRDYRGPAPVVYYNRPAPQPPRQVYVPAPRPAPAVQYGRPAPAPQYRTAPQYRPAPPARATAPAPRQAPQQRSAPPQQARPAPAPRGGGRAAPPHR